MQTAYLHVGMHKTGTSAFQNFCHKNRDALRAAGLVYPHLPLSNHSSFLDARFRRNGEVARKLLQQRGHAVLFDRREEMWRAFSADAEAAARDGLDFLVSGETASQLPREEAQALADALAQWFPRVVVLGLVRPPVSYARSSAQQRIRGGTTFAALREAPPTPNYRIRFSPHQRVLGRRNVRLRLFARDTLVDGCVLQTLLAMMDGDRSALASARAQRVNEAWSATAAKFTSLLFESLDAGEPSRALPPPARRHLQEGFCGAYLKAVAAGKAPRVPLPPPLLKAAMSLPGPRFALPREIAERLQTASAKDDAWIATRLGRDVRDYDELTTDSLPTLADMRRFDAAEADAITRTLQEVNDTVRWPYARMMRRAEANTRQRATRFLKAIDGGRVPTAADRRAATPAVHEPTPPSERRPQPRSERLRPLARLIHRISRPFRKAGM